MESTPAPWEQQPGERDQPFRRFRAWLDLGPDRSLSAFGAAQGISRQAAYQQAKRWDWVARARAWDAAQSPGGCPPPPAPKQRPPARPARPQAHQEPPQTEALNLLNAMAAEMTDQEHQLQEMRDYIETMRGIGRCFINQSRQTLSSLSMVQDNLRLEIEQRRKLTAAGNYAAAAEAGKIANQTVFMISRLATAATSLAASGRQHWGDGAGLLEILQKVYGGSN